MVKKSVVSCVVIGSATVTGVSLAFIITGVVFAAFSWAFPTTPPGFISYLEDNAPYLIRRWRRK